MQTPELQEYKTDTSPVIPLNEALPEEVIRWQGKRDRMIRRWVEIGMLNMDQTWIRGTTQANKVAMCKEACEELHWSMLSFDSKMTNYVSKHRFKLRKKRKRERKSTKQKKRKKVLRFHLLFIILYIPISFVIFSK